MPIPASASGHALPVNLRGGGARDGGMGRVGGAGRELKRRAENLAQMMIVNDDDHGVDSFAQGTAIRVSWVPLVHHSTVGSRLRC